MHTDHMILLAVKFHQAEVGYYFNTSKFCVTEYEISF